MDNNTPKFDIQNPEFVQAILSAFANSPKTVGETQGSYTQQPGYQENMAAQNPIPQQQQNSMNQQSMEKTMLQHLIENAGPLGIKSVSHDEKGGAKVEFQPPNANVNNTQANPTDLGTINVAKPQQPKVNPTANPNGNQQFIPNSNFLGFGGPDQQGNVRDVGTGIKILQLLAGGGVANPTETAMAAQQMKGQQPIQPVQKAERQAAIYGTQIGALKDLQTSLGSEAERTNNFTKTILDSRSFLDKTLGTGKTKEMVNDLKVYQNKIKDHLDLVNQQLTGAISNPPKLENNKKTSTALTGKTSSGMSWKVGK